MILITSLWAVDYYELHILFIVSLDKIVHQIIVGAWTDFPTDAGNEITFIRPATIGYGHLPLPSHGILKFQ
jgi:hypothetical protein